VAIQKTAENYDERTGGKMELQALKMYLMSRYGVERVDALFWEVSLYSQRVWIYWIDPYTLLMEVFIRDDF